jgi:outer membrane lipoprotein-sorting protein
MKATVDLAPTAGSVYSGVIKEYHDVKGFILLEKPATIRMIGQAPVVRTDIFDMVAEGNDFRLYIPSKQKFIVGKTTYHRPTKNALESLRPQHILDALLVPPLDSTHEEYFSEEAEEAGRSYYAVHVLVHAASSSHGPLAIKRKIWFDRSTLDIARLQLYGPGGELLEDVRYSDEKDFGGVRYPTSIRIVRPVEDYRLTITILKATFNEPIAAEKFALKKPESAQLVRLGEGAAPGGSPVPENSSDQ